MFICLLYTSLGWQGKSTILLHPKLGTWLTLGVIVDVYKRQDIVFEEDAGDEILDLHGGLVGLDFAEHVARVHLVAFLFQPFDQRADGHGVAELGHFDDFGHGGKNGRWARGWQN